MIESLQSELKKNSRTRWLLLLALAIGWIWLVVILRDSLLKRERVLKLADAELSRLAAEDPTIDWAGRLDQAIAARNRAVDVLWREPTIGLAQAKFQDWLNGVALTLPVTRKQVQLIQANAVSAAAFSASVAPTEPLESVNDRYWTVRGRIDADFTPAALNQLLAAVNGSSKRVIIETLNVKRENPARIEAIIVARFLNPAYAAQPLARP